MNKCDIHSETPSLLTGAIGLVVLELIENRTEVNRDNIKMRLSKKLVYTESKAARRVIESAIFWINQAVLNNDD